MTHEGDGPRESPRIDCSMTALYTPDGGLPFHVLSDRIPRAEPKRMPNAFDPYREALVVEQHTVWPDAYEDWSAIDKQRVAALLHASPREAADLDYLRQHTGFARVITVSAADVDRVSVA